jgi:hypothetical protein
LLDLLRAASTYALLAHTANTKTPKAPS